MRWDLVVTALVQLALGLFDRFQQAGMIKLGQDKEIARAAAALLDRTEEGRRLRAKIDAIPDADLSLLWDRLVDDQS